MADAWEDTAGCAHADCLHGNILRYSKVIVHRYVGIAQDCAHRIIDCAQRSTSVNVNVNVNNLLAISKLDFDNSGEPGPQAKGLNHLETPLRHLHATHRASSCAKRGGHMQLRSKPRGGTRNRTRDLPKKGSAFITSSDHWTRRPLDQTHVHALYRMCDLVCLDTQSAWRSNQVAGCLLIWTKTPL